MNDESAANTSASPTRRTLRTLLLLASAGIAATPVPSAHAQGSFKTDTAGNMTTGSSLNLGSPGITGTLSPTHLGAGTPSSATVLRGDGTWVGTTPTGNTIAATGNLLMGDGAGNAAAVANGADLFRVLKTRLESVQAAQPLPGNLLPTAADPDHGISFNGTINADGTLTIPANGSVQWQFGGLTVNVPMYGYMVATTEQPPGALVMDRTDGYDRPSTNATLAPGVYRSTFTSPPYDSCSFAVENTTSAPITIYFPVLAYQDTGLALIRSYADHTTVAAPPVADFDFTRFASADRSSRYLDERQTTLAADSVNGSAGNAGTLYAPKLSLQQTLANGAVFGLYRGSLFRESLPLGTLGTTHGIVVQDLALGSLKPLPVVSALDPIANGDFNDNDDGTFSYLYTATDSTILNDGYQNVYAVEINMATEAGLPVSSRRRMVDVTTQSAVVATAGSAWVQSPGTGAGQSGSTTQWKVTIHPTGGNPPRDNIHRYEVVSRFAPADWGGGGNTGDGAMSGVELVGSSWGYGSLGGPLHFVGDRLALLHCSTHNAVIGGGSLQRSVFYESGDATPIQLAWYAPDPTGVSFDTRRCLFYANVGDREANGLIAHSSGPNYARGDVSDCAFLGARWSDGSLHGTALDYENVAQGVIERVYVQGIETSFGPNMPATVEIKNSVFRQVNQTPIGSASFHDNLVAAESSGSNYGLPEGFLFRSAGAVVIHNLFLARGVATAATGDKGAKAFSFYSGVTTGTATRNIMVVSPLGSASAYYCDNLPADVSGVSLDYNLVICTAPQLGTGAGRATWADYRTAYPTLDVHSLYVDLSNDPRGLQAVFADPDHGDFRWAQTEVARGCAAYCAANHVGPATVTSRWPVVPSVDEAMRLLTDL